MRKSRDIGKRTFKDLFYGLFLSAGIGFVIGSVIVGGIAWFIHGVLTGDFGRTIYIRGYFGCIVAAIGLITGPFFLLALSLVKKKKSVIASMIVIVVVLLIGSLLWGVYNYEKITSKVKSQDDYLMANYPAAYFLVLLILVSLASYSLWRRYKKGESTDSLTLYFILYGLLLFIAMLGFLSTIFK
jgi:drug/metabolite transporter (DMT)-like permease